MADEHVPENPDHAGEVADTEILPDAAHATATSSGTKDWVVPTVGLGLVLASVLLFAGGFFVGRATDDAGQVDAEDVVVVQAERRGIVPRGFTFEDFDRRGPQGRFDDQRPRQFQNFGSFPDAARDRLCDLLDDGAIPPDAPFVDRLSEFCSRDDV